MDTSVSEEKNVFTYDDTSAISEYAIEAIKYAIGNGIINGKTESTINPGDYTTRAEVAVILERILTSGQ